MLTKTHKLLGSLAAALYVADIACADGARIYAETEIEDTRGDVHTCAGIEVFAIPSRGKSDRIINKKYGAGPSGYLSIYETPELILRHQGTRHMRAAAPDAMKLFRTKLRHTEKTTCTDAGAFEFTGLEPGDYYLVVPVFWKRADLPNTPVPIRIHGTGRNDYDMYIPSNYRGGTYMIRLTLAADENVEFLLKNQYEDPELAEGG